MELSDYKSGDKVEVLILNIQTDRFEWREAEVLDVRTIHPRVGEKHLPYPIVIVRVKRTYCKATTPIYRFVDNIPVFVDNNLEFFDKENDEGVLYENTIRLKV